MGPWRVYSQFPNQHRHLQHEWDTGSLADLAAAPISPSDASQRLRVGVSPQAPGLPQQFKFRFDACFEEDNREVKSNDSTVHVAGRVSKPRTPRVGAALRPEEFLE